MRVLVAGATGAVGRALTPRLLATGHQVRAISRRTEAQLSAANLTLGDGVEVVTADLTAGDILEAAFDGIAVAYYLVHSMEASSGAAGFASREATAALSFAAAARRAGVQRIVYLGGLVPSAAPVSEHLSSRLAVERVLLDAVDDSIAFRASIVIGARSRAFRFLVRLIERMPVLVLGAWREHRTAPVDERDAVECLLRAADLATEGGQSLDIAGPEVVSYGDLVQRIRERMLIDRPTLNLPAGVSLTPLASRVSALIAQEQHELIGPLMESLGSDLLAREPTATTILGVRRHTLDAAIEHALREWELEEPLAAR